MQQYGNLHNLNNNLPEYMGEMRTVIIAKYNTRNPKKCNHQQCTTSNCQKVVVCLGPTMWDKLPSALKSKGSIASF